MDDEDDCPERRYILQQVDTALNLLLAVVESGGSFERVTIEPDGVRLVRPRSGSGPRVEVTYEQEVDLRFMLDICRELSWRRCVELVGQ